MNGASLIQGRSDIELVSSNPGQDTHTCKQMDAKSKSPNGK
jgi:hypothetical protein